MVGGAELESGRRCFRHLLLLCRKRHPRIINNDANPSVTTRGTRPRFDRLRSYGLRTE